jgi:hypothetical protein
MTRRKTVWRNEIFQYSLIGLFNLPSATTFYPTEEEFSDPWTYLNSVNSIISEVGICIVQPPKSWDKESFIKNVDPTKYNFPTKTQILHKLFKRNTNDFGFDQGTTFTIQEFHDMADNFELLWSRCKTNDEKEKEYWKIIENVNEVI